MISPASDGTMFLAKILKGKKEEVAGQKSLLPLSDLKQRLADGRREREDCWTEAVAIGDEAFVLEAEQGTPYRQSMERYELGDEDGSSTWVVRERRTPYTVDLPQESAI